MTYASLLEKVGIPMFTCTHPKTEKNTHYVTVTYYPKR